MAKKNKENNPKQRKQPETKLWGRNFIKGINTWSVQNNKILLTILKMDRGGTLTNGPKGKKIDDYVPEGWYRDYWKRKIKKRKWRTRQHRGVRRCINTRSRRMHKKEQINTWTVIEYVKKPWNMKVLKKDWRNWKKDGESCLS